MSTPKERGQYAKGRARREEILDIAVDTFGRLGYHASSMRDIAASCGLSQAGLLHHFPNKEALLLALVERRDEEQERRSKEDGAPTWQEGALRTLEWNLENAAVTQLWTTLAAEATDPDHPAHEYFRARYERTQGNFSAWFAHDSGHEVPTEEDAMKAHLFTAIWDGLQQQSLLNPDFDMRPAFRYALVMLSRYSQYA